MIEAEPFRRQWRLCQRLSTLPEGETLADLAGQFDVDPKTIQRDIATLRAVGLEVVESTEKFGRKRWRVRPDTMRVPNFLFDEATAIYLGRKFLEPLAGTIFWEASQRAFAKLRRPSRMMASLCTRNLGDNTFLGASPDGIKEHLGVAKCRKLRQQLIAQRLAAL